MIIIIKLITVITIMTATLVYFILYFWLTFICLWSAAIERCRWCYTNFHCNGNCDNWWASDYKQ